MKTPSLSIVIADAVNIRVHRKGNLGAKPRSEAIAHILESIRERPS
jgi:hypothetical protein